MKQKVVAIFAVFVGAIMVFSAFSGFIFRGGNEPSTNVNDGVTIDSAPLEGFGMNGALVDMPFAGLSDLLAMCPENTSIAYWIDQDASPNLTSSVSSVISSLFQPSVGIISRVTLYQPTVISRSGVSYFNGTWAEYHYIKPFKMNYQGFVVPYFNYMMVPATTDFYLVMGRPTLFGSQSSMEQVLDTLIGNALPTDRFTIPFDETADLQVASLGRSSGIITEQSMLPLGGGYKELYLGLSGNGPFNMTAKFVTPDAACEERITQAKTKFGLSAEKGEGNILTVTGTIPESQSKDLLTALLSP
jgi:hypothetical protein